MKRLLLFFAAICCIAITSRAATISGTITYSGSYGPAVSQKAYLIDSTVSWTSAIDSTYTSSTGAYSFTLTMSAGHSYGTMCNSCGYPSYYWSATSSTSSANIGLYCTPMITDTVRILSSSALLSGQKVYIKNSSSTYMDSGYTNYSGVLYFHVPASVSAGTLTVYTYACGLQSQSFTYSGASVFAPTLYVCNPPVVSGTLANASTSNTIPYYNVILIDSSATALLYKDSVYTNSYGFYSFTLPFTTPAGNVIVTTRACGNSNSNSAAFTGSNLTLNLSVCATSSATISGILVAAGTSIPIVGQKVYFLDSTASLQIRDSVLTSATGAYSFSIPASTASASLTLSTISCGALQSQYQWYYGSSIAMPNWGVYAGAARAISGTIYYKSRSGAPGVNVSLYRAGTTTTPYVYATTGTSGTYSVAVPCDWNAGNVVIYASVPSTSCPGIVDTFSWSGSSTSGLLDTLSYNAPATISGTVYDKNGTPVSTGVAYITNFRSTPSYAISAILSGTGTYSATIPCDWTAGTLAIDASFYSSTLICGSPLRYFTWPDTNMSGLTDTVCLYRISGTVSKQGAGAAANAKVYVVRSYLDTALSPDVTTLTAIDSTITNSAGQYKFELDYDPYGPYGAGIGYYTTFVKAALQPSDPAYGNFLPTYHDSSLVWSSADTVAQITWYNRLGGVNISLRSGTNPGGPGFIGGNVLLGANKNTGVGDPLAQRILLLTTAAGKAVGFAYSDAVGKFAFPSLPYGSYLISGDAWGKANPALAVTISAANPMVNSIVFEENSEHFQGSYTTAVPEVSALEMVSVYPNPVTAQINFVGLNAIKGEKQAVIRSMTGVIVVQTKRLGDRIDVTRLPAGVYMVQLITDNGTANFRFVKE